MGGIGVPGIKVTVFVKSLKNWCGQPQSENMSMVNRNWLVEERFRE